VLVRLCDSRCYTESFIVLLSFFLSSPCVVRALHSFPTRRSSDLSSRSFAGSRCTRCGSGASRPVGASRRRLERCPAATPPGGTRSEEHTSELQSREKLVCRLLLEKKNSGIRR